MPYGTINADLMTTSDGVSSSGLYGFKNRIINGAMMIDQRNAGASVTPTTASGYSLDRWVARITQNSKLTIQQNAGAVTPPTGFTNYLGITSSSAYSVLSTDVFTLAQPIEGFNVADLGFGTASSSTVTLSFWVRSSLTGSFGGALVNNGGTRSYPFAYTISLANTWEQKTVTIAGDTSGTWLKDNGVGLEIRFGLGAGSNYTGTANTWGTANAAQPTSTVSIVGTNGATFYITGVQLEKGSIATSFDYRPYGTELALCQRYFEIVGATANSVLFQTYAGGATTGQQRSTFYYKATKRTSPTVTVFGTWSYSNAANLGVASAGVDATRVEWDATAGGITFAYNQNAGSYLTISAEL